MREYTSPGEVTLPEDANLLHPVWYHATETPDRKMLAYRDGDRFVDVTAAQFAARVQALARGLVGLGVEVDDRVCIMSKTRIEWTYLQYAAMAAGATVVPIYETDSVEQVEWIIADSGARIGFFETAELRSQWQHVADAAPLDHVFVIDEGGLDELTASGNEVTDDELDRRGEKIGPDSVATIIYTSGTTGRPKGCVTLHHNLRWDAVQAIAWLPELFSTDDRTLLFLPLAHSFAQLIQAGCVEAGVQIGYATSPQELIEELPMLRPTFLLSVPRIWEKVYNGAVSKASEEGKAAIFKRAVDVAIEHSRHQQAGRSPSLPVRLQHAVFDRLVYSKLRSRMGGELRYAVSGGAALGERLGHFYNGIGVTILEGYGLTETSAGATANRPSGFKVGTVGQPFPGVSLRIADDGEVLIKGPNVFAGYWRNEEATREVLDDDGWFHTGDIGDLDDDGFLRITGRKKELIVTAGGKNVAPAVLEDRLRSHPLVSQSMVVGDDRPFIGALITIDPDEFPRWADQHGKQGKSVADLTDDPDLRATIQEAVDHANAAVSRAESIREFRILPQDFTIEGGELTPTLKVKRRVVVDKYDQAIEDIYAEA
ncbi:MAG TPA: long-chain fatty acid--CoA ligase [Nitriliruptorales bacterium]|nr:long-chain fatty acid--CoA ligase [Nitriliruptorales bacterium]